MPVPTATAHCPHRCSFIEVASLHPDPATTRHTLDEGEYERGHGLSEYTVSVILSSALASAVREWWVVAHGERHRALVVPYHSWTADNHLYTVVSCFGPSVNVPGPTFSISRTTISSSESVDSGAVLDPRFVVYF